MSIHTNTNLEGCWKTFKRVFDIVDIYEELGITSTLEGSFVVARSVYWLTA